MKTYMICSLIVLTSVFVVSCDFQKFKVEPYLYQKEASLKRIKLNIEEAKVLSGIAILNENIILLSQLSGVMNESYDVKKISNKLKKDHLNTKKDIYHLAEKKLILLPNTIEKKKINDFEKTTNENVSNIYLNDVSKLLKNEILQLEYLSIITDDVDFKVLGAKTIVNLEYNYNQIQNILKINY